MAKVSRAVGPQRAPDRGDDAEQRGQHERIEDQLLLGQIPAHHRHEKRSEQRANCTGQEDEAEPPRRCVEMTQREGKEEGEEADRSLITDIAASERTTSGAYSGRPSRWRSRATLIRTRRSLSEVAGARRGSARLVVSRALWRNLRSEDGLAIGDALGGLARPRRRLGKPQRGETSEEEHDEPQPQHQGAPS